MAPNTYQVNKEKIAKVLQLHGYDSLSYFHLQENRQYFFSPSGNSFLSFRIFNKVAIVAADPVGPNNEIPFLLSSFLDYAKTWKLQPCFIGLSDMYVSHLRQHTFKIRSIGEEAVLSLPEFSLKRLRKKVRRAVRHVALLGIQVFFFSSATLPSTIRQQIEGVSEEWLKRKGKKEKGFSMTLRRLPTEFDKDCQFVVAMQDEIVVGYACFVPAYQRNALSLDHIRKRNHTPNGLNEFLVVKSAEYFREKRILSLSLNFAAFSYATSRKTIPHLAAKVLFRIYKCHSLKAFNEKFFPSWENRYVAYTSLRHLPLYILAVFRAER